MKKLTASEAKNLLTLLQSRFEKNKKRHSDIHWEMVMERLNKHPEKLWSLNEMERSGGEPDVIGIHKKNGTILFADCVKESPAGRRSLCYDHDAWVARKENKPAGSAMGMANEMGISIMNEEEYKEFQKLGPFDTKTSSWLKTPDSVRVLGGAIFGDYRYGRVFIYHNGVQSYYASRGFRGILEV
jgi:hypothetical protein